MHYYQTVSIIDNWCTFSGIHGSRC